MALTEIKVILDLNIVICEHNFLLQENFFFSEKTDLESENENLKIHSKPSSHGWKSGGKSPPRVQYIELLSNMLSEQLPELWRLGQSYFTGKLLKQV